MKPLACLCFLLLSLPALAQVDGLRQDVGLRQFFGVSSIGASIPITPEYRTGYFAVLMYRDGVFEKMLADQGVIFSYGGIPVSVGNYKLGIAPSAVQGELLWGERNGKMGYILRANVGSSGVVPVFKPYPEFAKVDSTISQLYFPGKEIAYEEFIVLGAAFSDLSTSSEVMAEQVKASKLAFVLVYQQFKTEEETKAFVEKVRAKYPAEPKPSPTPSPEATPSPSPSPKTSASSKSKSKS